jgi:DeoR/GlpR family transcriptional regulator of sugar metabolism
MTRILAANRHRAILRRLDEAEAATVEELAATLGVSRETIRRDLKRLSAEGRLSVVHGGALRGDRSEAPFAQRRMLNRAGKEIIAGLAAGLVGDGMSVVLDSGTTTEAVAQALARSGCERLVVHTPSLANARIVSRLPGARVFLLGGEFDRNDDATAGAEALRAVARLSADLAFASVGGIDEAGRATDYTRAGAAMRSAVLRTASQGYLLADATKFGRSLPSPIPHDETVAGLLVDVVPPPVIAEALAARAIRIVAPPS